MAGILEEDYLNIARSEDYVKEDLYGSTVLITGATGLVGMFLAKSLIYMNTELGAGIRLPSTGEEDIRKAVARVISEKCFKQCAEKIAESFRDSGGIKEAAAFIESIGLQKAGT